MLKFFVLFTIGSVIGSFCQVVAVRGLRAATLTTTPSHCDYCGQRLKWFELIPICSYLWLLGKCRNCRHNIPLTTLFSEMAGGSLALFYTQLTPDLPLLLIGFLLLIMSLCDWQALEVPSYLLIIAAGLVVIAVLTTSQLEIWQLIILILWSTYQKWPVFHRWLGAADIDIIVLYSLLAGPIITAQAILISSGLAIICFKFWTQRQLPFVPFLGVSYYWLLWCLL